MVVVVDDEDYYEDAPATIHLICTPSSYQLVSIMSFCNGFGVRYFFFVLFGVCLGFQFVATASMV